MVFLPDDYENIALWVRKNDFKKVAVYLADDIMGKGPDVLEILEKILPDSSFFLLGDKTQSGHADEVGASNLGADCILYGGLNDAVQTVSLPLFSVAPQATAAFDVEKAAQKLKSALPPDPNSAIVLLCDFSCHSAADAIAAAFEAPVFVAAAQRGSLAPRCQQAPALWWDWRFGAISMARGWWAGLGPLTKAAAATPRSLRIAGRHVRLLRENSQMVANKEEMVIVPANYSILYVGPPNSAIENRLALRYAEERSVWRLDIESNEVTRLNAVNLMTSRYRLIEKIQKAKVVGLLLSNDNCASLTTHLEDLLEESGKEVFRFLIGKATPEKLNNFPEVDCWVSLASSQFFPWRAPEFYAAIVSPYEVEVAVGYREWTSNYLTDPEENIVYMRPG